MRIGIMTTALTLNAVIPALFSEASYLIIVNAETGAIISLCPREGQSDTALAWQLVKHDCEAVICGPIEKEPFIVIADEGCVTRYYGVGLTAATALRALLQDRLPLITDCIGGHGCESTSSPRESENRPRWQRHGQKAGE